MKAIIRAGMILAQKILRMGKISVSLLCLALLANILFNTVHLLSSMPLHLKAFENIVGEGLVP